MSSQEILSETKEVELALPENGFSSDFLNDLVNFCALQGKLMEAYITMKKNDEDISLFFSFLFESEVSKEDQNNSVGKIMEKIILLFKDQVSIDAVSLNGKEQLIAVLRSVTAPYFKRA